MRRLVGSWRGFDRRNGWEYGPWWTTVPVDQAYPITEGQVALVQVKHYGRGWHLEIGGRRRSVIIGYMHSPERHPSKWDEA